MIWILVFAGIFFGLGLMAHRRAKDEVKIYAKIASISLFFISAFFLYQFAYYSQIGSDIAKFSNSGDGVSYFSNVTNVTTVFYSTNDTQVGEYFAMQQSNRGVLEILSGIIPILAVLLGGYFLWYYVEEGLMGRDGDRVS